MSAYARGADRERQLAKQLEADGWLVTRSAGSRSPHDLVAIRPAKLFGGEVSGLCEVYLIQCKTDKAGAFGHFGPGDRKELLGAATKAGAQAFLVHWPAHAEPRWIGPEKWPGTNTLS